MDRSLYRILLWQAISIANLTATQKIQEVAAHIKLHAFLQYSNFSIDRISVIYCNKVYSKL